MPLKYPSAIPGLEPLNQGKTRDIFRARAKIGKHARDKLLCIVATDRISTHNIVHLSNIPLKGEVLTALTVFWLTKVLPKAGIKTHYVAHGRDIYNYIDLPIDTPRDLHFRSIIVKHVEVLKVEFIYRQYLLGSFYKDYYRKGLPNPYGIELPSGLQLMHRFNEPLFTPTEKSENDEPLKADDIMKLFPKAEALARATFKATAAYLTPIGYTQLDGKYEVGHDENGVTIIVDEVSTPDSCRFTKTKDIVIGQEPPYADKQIARDEAERVWGDGKRMPLEFRQEIISRLSQAYIEMEQAITGHTLEGCRRELFGD